MTTLVLTIVGNDRAGLVAAVADVVDAHGGNWEQSQLTELAGAFAGVIQVSVPGEQVGSLSTALEALDGLMAVTVQGREAETSVAAPVRLVFQVLGNDHPGIVREISSTLSAQGVSIERMTTQILDAAMAGGRLFEATITATLPASVDSDDLKAELERLGAEIQVDVTLEN